jgi:hypothetical protein
MNYRVLTLLLVGIAPVQAAIASSPIINLECKIQSTQTYSTGHVERDNGFALVEIREQEHTVLIQVSSGIQAVNNISVSNHSGETPTFSWIATNSGTDTKWEVTRKSTPKTTLGIKDDARITIDRVSGTLIITNHLERGTGWRTLIASGSCEKSSEQKKF